MCSCMYLPLVLGIPHAEKLLTVSDEIHDLIKITVLLCGSDTVSNISFIRISDAIYDMAMHRSNNVIVIRCFTKMNRDATVT